METDAFPGETAASGCPVVTRSVPLSNTDSFTATAPRNNLWQDAPGEKAEVSDGRVFGVTYFRLIVSLAPETPMLHPPPFPARASVVFPFVKTSASADFTAPASAPAWA